MKIPFQNLAHNHTFIYFLCVCMCRHAHTNTYILYIVLHIYIIHYITLHYSKKQFNGFLRECRLIFTKVINLFFQLLILQQVFYHSFFSYDSANSYCFLIGLFYFFMNCIIMPAFNFILFFNHITFNKRPC